MAFVEKRQGPDTPEKVVKQDTVQHLPFKRLLVLGKEIVQRLTLLVFLAPVMVKVISEIVTNEQIHFFVAHDVVRVPVHTIVAWVAVVVHGLVDVHANVHGHRIPPGILIVNDKHISIVPHRHQDVVLVAVIVRDHIGKGVDVGLVEAGWLVGLWDVIGRPLFGVRTIELQD